MFKVLKDKNGQPRILYPAKLSFRYEGEIKAFPDTRKLRELSTKRPAGEGCREGLLGPNRRTRGTKP